MNTELRAAASGQQKKETPSLFKRTTEPKPEEQKETKPVLEDKRNDFDAQMVADAWAGYRKERYDAGASDTEKLVLDRRIEKSGEHNLIIYLHSQLETSILEKFEADLIRYFRKTLVNTQIQLEKEVNEEEQVRNLYTSREKFEYMASLNPALRQLKERLGLDFDF